MVKILLKKSISKISQNYEDRNKKKIREEKPELFTENSDSNNKNWDFDLDAH